MAHITLVNLNMLFVRYAESYEKELHLPLGPLYLTTVLEKAGYEVDFRDYQLCEGSDPFDLDTFVDFMADPAGQVERIYRQFGLAFTDSFAASINAYIDSNPADKHGGHRHFFSDTGLDVAHEREKVRDYQDYFGVTSEVT